MKLTDFMPQQNVILGVAEMVSRRFPNFEGACELMSAELVKELKKRNVRALHAVGTFRLDEPDAERYAEYEEDGHDEYEVAHDWVEVEGKILDISAKQFAKSVHEKLPNIVFIGYDSPLYNRYQLINYHG